MIHANPLRLVRQLKGAPLSCLVILTLVQQRVTARFLCEVTGYGSHAVTAALKDLEGLGIAACNTYRSGWRLRASVGQYPLGPALFAPLDGENRDPSLEEDLRFFKDSSLSLDSGGDRENRDGDRGNRDGDRENCDGDREYRDPFLEKRDPDRENRAADREKCNGDRENRDLDPERILAATKALFGERIYPLPGPVDTDQMLACIAEAYSNRDKLAHPARAAYSNLRQGSRPDEKFQDYRAYLPESFLADCGLLPVPPSSDWDPDTFPELEPGPDDPAADLEPDPLPTREPDPSLLLPLGPGRPAPQAAWRTALVQLELEIPRGAFGSYVEPSWLSRFDPATATFTIAAHSSYARDWLESRLASSLTRLLTGICNQTVRVCFTLER